MATTTQTMARDSNPEVTHTNPAGDVLSEAAHSQKQLAEGCGATFCGCFPCCQFEEQTAQQKKTQEKIIAEHEAKAKT
jgi:hypothetical protein